MISKDRTIRVGHNQIEEHHVHPPFAWYAEEEEDLYGLPVTSEDVMKTAYVVSEQATYILTSTNPVFFDSTKGVQGPKGQIGDQGSQGPSGDSGIKGVTGVQGPVGNKGLVGDQGDTGDEGPKGATGDKGQIGLVGPAANSTLTGIVGKVGSQGPTGDTGPKGPIGDANTVQGPQGDEGPQGPKGDVGDEGPANLAKGPTGDTGPKGPIGDATPGPKGPANTVIGPPGEDGVIGDIGALGDQGLEGDAAIGLDTNILIDGVWPPNTIVDYDPTFRLSTEEITSKSTESQYPSQAALCVNASIIPTSSATSKAQRCKSINWATENCTIEYGEVNSISYSFGYDSSFTLMSSSNSTISMNTHSINPGAPLGALSHITGMSLKDTSISVDVWGQRDADGSTSADVEGMLLSLNNVDFSISNGDATSGANDNQVDMHLYLGASGNNTLNIVPLVPADKLSLGVNNNVGESTECLVVVTTTSDVNETVTIDNTGGLNVTGQVVQSSSSASVLFPDDNSGFHGTMEASGYLKVTSTSSGPDANFSTSWGRGFTPKAEVTNIRTRIEAKTGTIRSVNSVLNGFDYAEYFPNFIEEEFDAGVIMTLVDDEVVPASSDDDMILGTVTRTASVAGDSCNIHWKDMYLVDEFGEQVIVAREWLDSTEYIGWLDEFDGDVPDDGVITTLNDAVLNPSYDASQTYVPRSERPKEWTLVSLLGQVYVRVYTDIESGAHVSATGKESGKETPLKCLKMHRPFSEEKGYGVAKCLLVPDIL